MTRGQTYTCANCGNTYITDWTDAEATAEAQALWTAEELTDTAIVCDDCFKRIRDEQGRSVGRPDPEETS